MTARIALRDLQPGDVIQDLIAAGTVTSVTPMHRPAGTVKVALQEGGFMAGPGSWTVTTTREEVDA